VTRIFTIPTNLAPAADQDSASPDGGVLSGFVVGPENIVLAHVADRFRQVVHSGDSGEDNPLVFYGHHALGKTYFAQLLTEFWIRERPSESVLNMPAADFAREFSNADKTKDIAAVRRRWDAAGLCVIDDIQYLAGRQTAQRELSRLCEVRRAVHRPLIVTSTHLPARLERLEQGLKSRLSDGLCVQFCPMSVDTCRFLLERLSAALEIALTAAQVEQWTHLLRGGSVPQLISRVKQLGNSSSSEPAVAALNVLDESQTVRLLLRLVADSFAVKAKDLTGKSRRRTIAVPRCLAMLLIRKFVGCSYETIGRYFGNRDHTTVMHCCKRGEELIAAGDSMRCLWDQLESRFNLHLNEHHYSLPGKVS
jgi:chromosomal replication initiator protein